MPLLKNIVMRWPKTAGADLDAIRSGLGSDLADGFDAVDLLNTVDSVVNVEAIEATDRRATIWFSDTDRALQRAVFELSPSGKWQLESLKFQCPVCFGTGINDGEKCGMCGGSGWGAS